MTAVGTVILQDVPPPHRTAAGNTASPYGLNAEGLASGFSAEALQA